MQRSGQNVALVAGEIDDVTGVGEDAGGTAGDFPPGLGQDDAAPAALQQLHAKSFFQLPNLHRECRLADGALFRGPAEMTGSDDRVEILQLFERDQFNQVFLSRL